MNFKKICVLGLGYSGLPTASTFATHGIKVVGVDINPHIIENGYYSLKDRVEKETSSAAAGSPARSETAFLELAVSPPSGAGECILEWEDAGGGKMRVHLKGVEVPDLVALSRSFWEGRR